MKNTARGKKLMVRAILYIALICMSGCGGGGGGGSGGEEEKQSLPSETVKTVTTNEGLASALTAGNSVSVGSTTTVYLIDGATLGGSQKISGGGTLSTNSQSLRVTGPASITGDGTTLMVESTGGTKTGLEVTRAGILNVSNKAKITVQNEGNVKVDGQLNVEDGAEVTIGSAGNVSVDIGGNVTINGTSSNHAKLKVGNNTATGSLTGVINVGQFGELEINAASLAGSGFDENASIVYEAGAKGNFPSPLLLGLLVDGDGAAFKLTDGTLTQGAKSYTLNDKSKAKMDMASFHIGAGHTLSLLGTSELTINSGKELTISNISGNGKLHMAGTATLVVEGKLIVNGEFTPNQGATIELKSGGSVSGVTGISSAGTYTYKNGAWTTP